MIQFLDDDEPLPPPRSVADQNADTLALVNQFKVEKKFHLRMFSLHKILGKSKNRV